MKLLLTNDDGIDAPGLSTLLKVANKLGEPTVIAPVEPHSGCSHRVTTGAPFRVSKRDERAFAVHGTPADCVRVAAHSITVDADWVLSGVNAGGNLGADVFHSGTVAAVREAVIHGMRGIALSKYNKSRADFDWPRVATWLEKLIPELMAKPLPTGQFWNVNFPHLQPSEPDPKVVFCPLESGPLPLYFKLQDDWWHYQGDYHRRPRTAGSDVDVCFGGNIAVTQMSAF